MITLTILFAILVVFAFLTIASIVVGGLTFLVVFADVIVAAALIALLIRFIIKKK